MFVTQVDSKPISGQEKFGYLLEMMNGWKGQGQNLQSQPSTIGYKPAWQRLKKEYGQTRLVVNAHIDEVVNLQMVRGSFYEKISAFY